MFNHVDLDAAQSQVGSPWNVDAMLDASRNPCVGAHDAANECNARVKRGRSEFDRDVQAGPVTESSNGNRLGNRKLRTGIRHVATPGCRASDQRRRRASYSEMEGLRELARRIRAGDRRNRDRNYLVTEPLPRCALGCGFSIPNTSGVMSMLFW